MPPLFHRHKRYDRIVCADGASVSIQAARHLYCTPSNSDGPYTHIEAAFPSVEPPTSWRKYATIPDYTFTETVYAYMPWKCVDEFINAHGGMVGGELPPRRAARPQPMPKFNGAIVYRGPSLLNGQPIVAIVTAGSQNEKTGDMDQLYILPDTGQTPAQSWASGDYASVCGDCTHRVNDTCYVVRVQGSRAVYAKYQQGGYPTLDPATLPKTHALRLGADGDPAAVPPAILRALVAGRRHTGYTHQWRTHADLRDLCMASCDTLAEAHAAAAQGWRVFLTQPNVTRVPGTILCPASVEAGKRTTCTQCTLCNGATANDRRAHIYIPLHGAKAVTFLRRRPTT